MLTKDFIGPDGTKDSFFPTSPAILGAGIESDKWIQYKIYLRTSDNTETPELFNVTVWYNYWPDTYLVSPEDEVVLNFNTPLFQWDFIDADSTGQAEFQLQVASNEGFDNIFFDSDEQISTEQSWQFPGNSGYTVIPDGTWYWRLRTKDNDGTWGEYSQFNTLIIDSTLPKSETTFPIDNEYYNQMESISGTVSDQVNGTGINNVEVAIIHETSTPEYWDGSTWMTQEEWLPVIGASLWSYNTSSVSWVSGETYIIKSRATDNAANVESPINSTTFTFDTDMVIFSDPVPLDDEVSNSKTVEVGITIADLTSMVDALTIEFTYSLDSGTTWEPWTPSNGYSNATEIEVEATIEFSDSDSNRIKWRATDVAGNGPTESEEYTISVYDISDDESIPKVKLLSPENEITVYQRSILLNWSLENIDTSNVTYDIFFDTVNPPLEKRIEDFTGDSVLIDDLKHGKIYYWTVVPKRITNTIYSEGICISGVWWFTVDFSLLPRITLQSPENGSIQDDYRPELEWSFEYIGGPPLTFEVYFDTVPDPQESFDGVDKSSLSFDYDLKDGETYYWKVVPFVEGMIGFESEVWSFTVEISQPPIIDFSITLDQTVVELKPDENITVIAKIINLGEIKDSIILKLIYPPESGIVGSIQQASTNELNPNDRSVIIIDIRILSGSEPQEIEFTVEGTSSKASDYDMTIMKNASLTVKIIEKGSGGSSEPSKSDDSWLIGLGVGIVLIIVVLVVIVFLMFKKKKGAVEKPEDRIPPSEVGGSDALQQTIPQTTPQQQTQIQPRYITQMPMQVPIPVQMQMPMAQPQPQLPPLLPQQPFTQMPMAQPQIPMQMPMQMQGTPQAQTQVPQQTTVQPAVPQTQPTQPIQQSQLPTSPEQTEES
jgi:hypothetical protein